MDIQILRFLGQGAAGLFRKALLKYLFLSVIVLGVGVCCTSAAGLVWTKSLVEAEFGLAKRQRNLKQLDTLISARPRPLMAVDVAHLARSGYSNELHYVFQSWNDLEATHYLYERAHALLSKEWPETMIYNEITAVLTRMKFEFVFSEIVRKSYVKVPHVDHDLFLLAESLRRQPKFLGTRIPNEWRSTMSSYFSKVLPEIPNDTLRFLSSFCDVFSPSIVGTANDMARKKCSRQILYVELLRLLPCEKTRKTLEFLRRHDSRKIRGAATLISSQLAKQLDPKLN